MRSGRRRWHSWYIFETSRFGRNPGYAKGENVVNLIDAVVTQPNIHQYVGRFNLEYKHCSVAKCQKPRYRDLITRNLNPRRELRNVSAKRINVSVIDSAFTTKIEAGQVLFATHYLGAFTNKNDESNSNASETNDKEHPLEDLSNSLHDTSINHVPSSKHKKQLVTDESSNSILSRQMTAIRITVYSKLRSAQAEIC